MLRNTLAQRISTSQQHGAGGSLPQRWTEECEEAVLVALAVELLLLNVPHDAYFENKTSVEKEDDAYVVSSWIHTRNAKGDVIRTPFTLSVAKVNGAWKAVSSYLSISTKTKVKAAKRTVAAVLIAVALAVIGGLIWALI